MRSLCSVQHVREVVLGQVKTRVCAGDSHYALLLHQRSPLDSAEGGTAADDAQDKVPPSNGPGPGIQLKAIGAPSLLSAGSGTKDEAVLPSDRRPTPQAVLSGSCIGDVTHCVHLVAKSTLLSPAPVAASWSCNPIQKTARHSLWFYGMVNCLVSECYCYKEYCTTKPLILKKHESASIKTLLGSF